MSTGLLSKLRKLNWVLQENTFEEFPVIKLCNILSGLTDSDVVIQTELNSELANDGKTDKIKAEIPILGGAQRLGTLILTRDDEEVDEDDLILAECAATFIGLDLQKKNALLQIAVGTLSYSEIVAMRTVLKELNGNEGLLVASKIADRSGMTRSVIVSALRKLESAGVVESRSLGMKGTFIRILNSKIIDSIDKMRT